MDFRQSLASPRQRPSQAKLRSTSHRRFNAHTPGQALKALGGVGPLDDFQRPVTDLVQRAAPLRAGLEPVPEKCERFSDKDRL